jgi:hypothetical protein
MLCTETLLNCFCTTLRCREYAPAQKQTYISTYPSNLSPNNQVKPIRVASMGMKKLLAFCNNNFFLGCNCNYSKTLPSLQLQLLLFTVTSSTFNQGCFHNSMTYYITSWSCHLEVWFQTTTGCCLHQMFASSRNFLPPPLVKDMKEKGLRVTSKRTNRHAPWYHTLSSV